MQLDIALLVQILLKSDIVCRSYDSVYFYPAHSVDYISGSFSR